MAENDNLRKQWNRCAFCGMCDLCNSVLERDRKGKIMRVLFQGRIKPGLKGG